MHRFLFYCAVLTLLLPAVCAARDVAVITDKANPSNDLSGKDLVKLLRKDTAKWPDGRKVTVYLREPSSPDGPLVLEKIFGMSAGELQAFAMKQKDIVILGSDELVVKAVSANPGAIGVVNVYSINSAVKVLKVDGKLPLEQGYFLRGK